MNHKFVSIAANRVKKELSSAELSTEDLVKITGLCKDSVLLGLQRLERSRQIKRVSNQWHLLETAPPIVPSNNIKERPKVFNLQDYWKEKRRIAPSPGIEVFKGRERLTLGLQFANGSWQTYDRVSGKMYSYPLNELQPVFGSDWEREYASN